MTSGTPSTLPVAIADARLADNYLQFVGLLGSAERLATAGDQEGAAVAARAAATWGWTNHPGIHASPRLERLLRSLVPLVPLVPRRERRKSSHSIPRGRRQRVLHVLTQVYLTGGHTRLTDRIIRADPARTHSVAIVAQDGLPIPAWLRRSVIDSGGQIYAFGAGGLMAQAIALRQMANRVDLVIANVHPFDVVAVLAFADPHARPPVVALNHADHCFWLGASAWDLLANVRRSGEELALRRRGMPHSRSCILPAPLDVRQRTLSREDAKRALGVRPDEIVLLSAGSDWKFDPHEMRGEPTFPDVVVPIVERDARLRLFVFGPINADRWAEASRRTDGRALALGTRTDLTLYQQAADIYLDPFPIGSTYSLLEAGSLGVPLLSFRQWPDEAATLFVDSPGLGDARIIATSRAEYEAALLALLSDPAAREARGRRTSEQIIAVHAGGGWRAALAEILATAPRARAAHQAEALDLDADLDVPAFDTLDRGIVAIPMRAPAVPERAIAHLPLAH